MQLAAGALDWGATWVSTHLHPLQSHSRAASCSSRPRATRSHHSCKRNKHINRYTVDSSQWTFHKCDTLIQLLREWLYIWHISSYCHNTFLYSFFYLLKSNGNAIKYFFFARANRNAKRIFVTVSHVPQSRVFWLRSTYLPVASMCSRWGLLCMLHTPIVCLWPGRSIYNDCMNSTDRQIEQKLNSDSINTRSNVAGWKTIAWVWPLAGKGRGRGTHSQIPAL